jgi:hypothetical protein
VGITFSSFSSSLGPNRSGTGNSNAAAGPSGVSSSAPDALASALDDSQQPVGDATPTTLGDRVSDARSKVASFSSERPEVVVVAAFAGGLVIATILKRLAR